MSCENCDSLRLDRDSWRHKNESDNAYLIDERDRWIRLFNRLQGAVQHHHNNKSDVFVDEVDEALYAAMARVLKEAARRDR